MFAGLAGSLRAESCAVAAAIGSRTFSASAVACAAGAIATATLDPDAVRDVRRAVPFCDSRVPLAGGMARHRAEDVA